MLKNTFFTKNQQVVYLWYAFVIPFVCLWYAFVIPFVCLWYTTKTKTIQNHKKHRTQKPQKTAKK